MPKILVLYYSRSGNTEKMATAVAEGARSISKTEVNLEYHIEPQDLGSYDAIIIGSPTYHHEMPIDIRRIFEEVGQNGLTLRGKIGAAFGSFGWSGEAPKLVLEIMKNKFEMRMIEPPFLSKYTPDATSLKMCTELGKRISESLIQPT